MYYSGKFLDGFTDTKSINSAQSCQVHFHFHLLDVVTEGQHLRAVQD